MGLFSIIPQSHCAIVERLGKFSRIQNAGLHFRLPLIEQRKQFVGSEWMYAGEPCAHKRDGHRAYSLIELTDQRLNTSIRVYHTRDNVEVRVDAVIFWRIVNPKLAVYAVDDVILSMIDVALNSLRSNIGAMTLDQVLSERASLTDKVTAELIATSAKWGIALQKVEIQELNVDAQTQAAMLKQMEAERERRAAISIAEGQSQSTLIQAEAEKKATILRAEGVSRSQELIAAADALYLEKICQTEMVSREEAFQILLAQKYIEGFSVSSQNAADKVFLPNSPSGLLVDGK